MERNRKRRLFLKTSLVAGLAGSAAMTGLLVPRTLLATWNQKAFESTSVNEALELGLAGSATEISPGVQIEAPDIAADGATVPVTVEVGLSGVESIAVLSEKNARPLCSIFHLGSGALPQLTTRIKMGKSGDVIAVAKAGGRLYMARRQVAVTVGGCN